jgi:lipopolysaccharide export system permease protein
MIFRLKLYQRYLMRETFAAVALVLVAFLVIFSFFELINELRDVGKNGQQMWHAVVFVVLGLPGLIYELIPIATLIGTLFALSTLARHSEITVLRASGLATRQLLMTLFRVALVLAVLTFGGWGKPGAFCRAHHAGNSSQGNEPGHCSKGLRNRSVGEGWA